MTDHVLRELSEIIRARRDEPGDKSYTRQLLDAGPEKCARKFGEESIEVLIAAMGSDRKALVSESADVIYHLLVLLEARGLCWSDVATVLEERMGTSGLAEKAARKV